jgi:diguanylate cyclase (GGDEF)-like protein
MAFPAAPRQMRDALIVESLKDYVKFGLVGIAPCAALAIGVLGDVDRIRLITWCTACVTCLVSMTALAGCALTSRGDQPIRIAYAVSGGAHAVVSLLVGLLPLLVPAPADRADIVLAYLLLAVGTAVSGLLLTGPDSWLFITVQGALLGTSTVVILVGVPGVPRAFAVLVLAVLALVLGGRASQNRLLMMVVDSRNTAQDLARALSEERDNAVSENERLAVENESLARQAEQDSMTGLANRSSFLEVVTETIERNKCFGQHLAILFIDIDRFKLVNDSLGHAAGDDLLITIANRLRQTTRSEDLVTRHGGDEFTVMLSRVRTAQDAVRVAERIRAAVAEPITICGHRVETTASIGVAFHALDSDRAADLLRFADAALYRAKDLGRNRIEVFDDSLRGSLNHRFSDESELRDALDSGQVVPWFQPVVDMETGKIVGAEALARWVHPHRGVIPPVEFVPMALEAGFASALTTCITEPALAFRQTVAPLVPPEFRVAVNVSVSPKDLGETIPVLTKMIREADLGPECLTLEITERVMISDVERARAALTGARDMGFAIALDDFGTGHSSLSLIRDLPLDIIKIDRSFVRGMAGNEADAAVIAAVIEMAKKLSLGVVAEGIEFAEDVTRLAEAGAVLAQGFWYSPAVPAEEFERWLREGPPWQNSARNHPKPPKQLIHRPQ